MQTNNQSKFKQFLVRRAKRSWIIAIGVVIALVVGGVYVAPDLVRRVKQSFAAEKNIQHTDWSGGPRTAGESLIITDPYTNKYDTSYNIDTTSGKEGIKLKTLDQRGNTGDTSNRLQLPPID